MTNNNIVTTFQLKTRLTGLFLLIKACLPLILFVFFVLFSTKVFSPNENKKLNNIVLHEVDILITHFNSIEKEFNTISKNTDDVKKDLLSIQFELENYLEGKIGAGKIFWDDVKAKLGETKQEFKDFKKELTIELTKYIEIVKQMITNLKNYVIDIIAYKDDLAEFLADLKSQLEPLNDVVDFIETLDVFDAFDVFTFEFPNLPAFPAFPSINWALLTPDLTDFKNRIIDIKDSVTDNIDALKNDINGILTPPDLSNIKAVFNSENLSNKFLNPIFEMGSIFNSYWTELKAAEVMISHELENRKSELQPWAKLITWLIVIYIILWFIGYLFNLKSRLLLAFKLLMGNDIAYEFKF